MTELQLAAWGTAAAGVGHTLFIQNEVMKRMECWNSEMDINELDCRCWFEDILGVLWASSFAMCLRPSFREGARILNKIS